MPAPDILTFRFNKDNNKLCYVVPPQSLEDGLRTAKENFQDELYDVVPSRINICVNAVVAGTRQHIRISPASWTIVLSKLRPYEVLDIMVQSSPARVPDIVVYSEDGIEKLPRYEDVRDKADPDDFLAPSCAPSPKVKSIPLETIRAAQRYPRRTPSPSRPSQPKNSSSSSFTDIAKAIFGKSSS
ncbi:hypothetical protein GSI_05674 [Ganoderma sinense ZZ0214-1]|uniref:Uncharacterized protein n=1 Tax=Ganoderma sinense ZZ0214-1 TaxID=1077348 RepID=A0A2G8SB55_9APHY|nr:hypothetical protein GSI_05674 [Ganoderma sinense ZZ0214-1]